MGLSCFKSLFLTSLFYLNFSNSMTNMNYKRYKYLIHTAIWILFFLMPAVFLPKPEQLEEIKFVNFLPILIFNFYLIVVFYFNAYILIPKFFIKKRFLIYFLSIGFLLLQFIVLPQYIKLNGRALNDSSPVRMNEQFDPRVEMNDQEKSPEVMSDNMPPEPPRDFQFREKRMPLPIKIFKIFKQFASITLFLLILLLSAIYRMSIEWFSLEEKNKRIAEEQLKSELHFLKAQINPHFLFNTLNSLYILALKKSEKAPEAILKLSDIMRHVLSDSLGNSVPLKQEIKYINQYIDLQQLRLTEKVNVVFEVKGDVDSYVIAPLIFITFIENAFQYGVSTRVNSSISILIEIVDETLHFNVVNNIIRSGSHDGNGIGIENSKRKLELLYPNAHKLTITNNDSTFEVDLTIQLKA